MSGTMPSESSVNSQSMLPHDREGADQRDDRVEDEAEPLL